MKNDKVIISLIIVVLITIVSVPSALAYFSTYTQTKGTKTLSFNYDTKLEESIYNNNKTISVTATGDPVFVRVRYYAVSDKMTVEADPDSLVVDGETVWVKNGDYYYYTKPIDGKGIGEKKTSNLILKVTTAADVEFAIGDVEHVIVIYEAIPAKYGVTYDSADWNVALDVHKVQTIEDVTVEEGE